MKPSSLQAAISAVDEAHNLVVAIAGMSPSLGSSVKEALARVANKTGLPHRRVRGFYNKEARAILAEEMDLLRRIAAEQRDKKEPGQLAELSERIERLERLLAPRIEEDK